MALEDLTGSAKFISALNPAWPVDDDWVDEGDNHIRGIKNVLRNTFPALDGPVTLTDEQMNGVLVAAPESRIINGNFGIDQRNAGATRNSAVNLTVFGPDRWFGQAVAAGASGTWSMTREANEAGYQIVIGVVTTVVPAAADVYQIGHNVEGYNTADFISGSTGVKPFIYAFSLHCAVAGTFPVAFRIGTSPFRSYVTTVSYPTANAWQNVVISVPADPTLLASVNNTNGIGLQVVHGLGIGTTYHAPSANTWVAGNFMGLAGMTNVMGGGTMRLKNARLYPGTIDYGRCQRLYADELRLCQRYFEKSYDVGTVPGTVVNNGAEFRNIAHATGTTTVYFRTPKRAAATVTAYSPATGAAGAWHVGASDRAATVTVNGENAFSGDAPGGVAGDLLRGHWTASAEL